MGASDYITRDEFERECEASRTRFGKIEDRQDRSEAQHSEHSKEIKTLKDLIADGFRELRVDFRDVRTDLKALKSVRGLFVTGLAAGAGISYALYQAIHAALGGHP